MSDKNEIENHKNQASGFDSDFKAFLSADLPKLSNFDSKVDVIKKTLKRDLVKSPAQMISIFGATSIIGYLVSFAICAQSHLGIFSFSYKLAHALHSLPGIVCPIVCGAIFTGIPFVVSLLFLNRFQIRYLLFRMWWVITTIPILTTSILLFLPGRYGITSHNPATHGAEISQELWLVSWTLSSILVPYIFEGLLFFKMKQKNYAVS